MAVATAPAGAAPGRLMHNVRAHIGIIFAVAAAIVIIGSWILRPAMIVTFGLLFVVGIVAATIATGPRVLFKVLALIPVLFLISLFSFYLVSALPGDPAVQMLGPGATPQAVAQVRAELNLDAPFWERYGDWLGDVVTGDLGTSLIRREPVAEGLASAFPVTLQLLLYSQIIAIGVAVPLGVFSAYRAGTKADRAVSTTAFGFLALPNFILAVLLVLFFALGGLSIFGFHVGSEFFPAATYVPFGENTVLHFKHLILPALALAAGQIATYMRLLRTDMISTLQQDFIQVARAKGMPDRRVLWRHALRPSSFTLLTVIGLTFGALIGGTVIIETIFTLPGVGTYLLTAAFQRDFVAVQGAVLVIATGYVLVLLIVDLAYAVLDPRLRDV
jgi:peptide/nickel transport system permease protein